MSPSWFCRPSASAAANPNLTTCIYTTDLGLFSLSWRRGYFGRSLHLRHHHHHEDSFHLRIKPFPFPSTRKGSRKLNLTSIHKRATVSWDLSAARFGSRPEPTSGFQISIAVDGELILLVGDSDHSNKRQSAMVLRREHVRGAKSYSTRAKIGGRERKLSIECRLVEDPRLNFSIDDKKVLQIKHLDWKFRGSERVEVDGDFVQVSWDVYKWLFHNDQQNDKEDGYALFMFDVFTERDENVENCSGMLALGKRSSIGWGFEEERKKRGGLVWRGGRNSSFSSFSSSGSCSSSTVMEWADNEDDEFMDYPYSGFSLHVYAWRT